MITDVGLGGMLCEVGLLTLPPELNPKKAKLSPAESEKIRKCPAKGRRMLEDLDCFSENVLRVVEEHHEKFNGEGYPKGLVGDKISFFARVSSIIEVFEDLTSGRYDKQVYTTKDALVFMTKESTGDFDPRVFSSFIKTAIQPV